MFSAIMGKCFLHSSTYIIDWIFVSRAGNQDRHGISDKFEFCLDQPSHFGVICSRLLKKAKVDIVQGIVFSFLSDLYETCR